MATLVVLSGPKTNEQQARTKLTSLGFNVREETHNHGLPDVKDGESAKRGRQAVRFLGIEIAKDVDPTDVREAVAGLGYVLRLHRELGPPPEPSADDVIAELRARVEALEEGDARGD